MEATPLFLCITVTLLAASLSVWGQEASSQLRQEMVEYKRQLENLFSKEVEALRHKMETELEAQRQREEELWHEAIQLRAELQQQDRRIQLLQESCSQHPTQDSEDGGVAVPDLSYIQQGDRKRSDDMGALEPVLSQVTQTLNVVTADVQALKNSNTGSVYVRWGNTACPSGSETVYSGYVGGSMYGQGSAANHLCLPLTPVFDDHPLPRYPTGSLYGAEYETCDEPECDMTPACSICRTPRQAQVMVPGTNVCQDGWHLEYSGYIMAEMDGRMPSEYICVDRSRGYVHGTQGNQNGHLLYYTAVHCTSLSCPPYVDNKIVSCAVCSK